MEETVPHASSPANNGGTSRQRAQHRNTTSLTSTATTTPNSTSTSAATPSVTAAATADVRDDNVDSDDGESSRRRHLHGQNQSIMSWLGSVPLLLSKILLLITVLLRVLFYPIRRVAKLVFPPGEFDDIKLKSSSDKAAKAFVSYFQSNFLANLPPPTTTTGDITTDGVDANDDDAVLAHVMAQSNPFVDVGYSTILSNVAAQTLAFESSNDDNPDGSPPAPPPLVLVYLHSPMHGQVPSFLSKTLCHPQLMTWINQNVQRGSLLCWGTSIHTADGASVQSTFGASTYPFLALVRVQKPSTTTTTTPQSPPLPRVELQLSISGPTLTSLTPQALQIYLSTTLQNHTSGIAEQTARRRARAQEVTLRQEQDREYRDALAADQERERAKAETERVEREALEAVEMVREEGERKGRERVERARGVLEGSGGEPVKGEVGCARIRFMFPSGQKVERRFRGGDGVELLRAFMVTYLDENSGIGIKNFELSSSYPRKVLVVENGDDSNEGGTATMAEENLCPQTVIMVQDLDS